MASSFATATSAALQHKQQSIGFAPGLRALPLLLIMSYLGTLFLLFLIWPISWQIYYASSWAILTAYVLAAYAMISTGYLLAAQPTALVAAPSRFVAPVMVIGALAAAVLLTPLSYVYTGRFPWQVLEVVQEQGDAYRALQEQLQQTAGQRSVIAFVRALLSPFTFAVVPLGILHWARIGWPLRLCIGVAIVCSVIFSFLRGTDREIAEIVLVSLGALMVALGRSRGEEASGLKMFLRRYWLILVAGVVFFTVAVSLFTERKSQRLGGFDNRVAVCANASRVCADIDAPLISWLPLSQRFGASIFILSSASGFYGLELALEKDFKSTYGLGHSPASLAIYELVTGDDQLKRRTYTYRNGFDGWSEENYWSTLIVWIANDVGFPAALVVLLGLGYVTGRAWRAAALARSDPAAVVFCALMITMFYLSANNQLLNSYDGYAILVAWSVAWLRERWYPATAVTA